MIKKVKIGIYEYEIKEVTEPLILNNSVCSGTIDYDNLIISIKSNMNNSKKQQTLWHEIMHGIIREFGVPIDRNNEEDIVDWLATGMCQVINDNPLLFNEVIK